MEIQNGYVKYNYPSAQKLYLLLGKKFTLERIKEVISSNKVHQLYKQQNKRIGGHILALAPMQIMQLDLSFMDKFGQQNGGYKYILLGIDVFSRYAWGVPLKSKSVKEVEEAFLEMPQPECVVSDNGSEFVGKDFVNYLKHQGIAQQTNVVGDHHALGIVDRMTLTLKNMIYKRFIGNDSVKWADNLQEILDIYNTTPHSGIYDFTPEEALNDKKVQAVLATINLDLMQKGTKKFNVEVGDDVRIRKPDWSFKRGFTPKFSEDIFNVEQRVGNTVIIDGKRHKIVDVQVVPKGSEAAGKALKVATKENKVKTILKKEGVDVGNIREMRKREIKFDKSLVGKRIDRGEGETGTITRYDEIGPYHWFVQYDRKAKLKNELMNREEIEKFLVR